MRRNYASVRSRLAAAVARELLREEGAWPEIKSKVRATLHSQGPTPFNDLYRLADVAAYAILESEEIRVTAVRYNAQP